jgi:hypothetical protein
LGLTKAQKVAGGGGEGDDDDVFGGRHETFGKLVFCTRSRANKTAAVCIVFVERVA